MRVCHSGRTRLGPLGVDLAGVDGGVRVGASHVDVIRLHDLGDLVVDAQDGLALLVGLRQRSFELVVGCDQSLCTTRMKIHTHTRLE